MLFDGKYTLSPHLKETAVARVRSRTCGTCQTGFIGDRNLCEKCRHATKKAVNRVCNVCRKPFHGDRRTCSSCDQGRRDYQTRYFHTRVKARLKDDLEFAERTRRRAVEHQRKIYASGRHQVKIQATTDAWLRYKLRRLKRFGITIAILQNLWDSQNGVCKLSGLPFTTKLGDLRSATVDRIDSSRGYAPDNTQLVCKFLNLGKGNRPDLEVIEWVDEVRNPTREPLLLDDDVARGLRRHLYDIRCGRRVTTRNKELPMDILERIWERQQGRCALTNVAMSVDKYDLFAASVDRLDTSVGYLPDNIQLVCRAANIGRCNSSVQDAKNWITALRGAT